MPEISFATHADARVLVVDDNPANLVFVQRLLAKAGYENVQCTSNPEEVRARCATFKPDLVILDLHMPGLSGYEVLEQIRGMEQELGPDDYLPVLVFTADVTSEARRRALELGASDFLTKPGDMYEITLRVRNFLEMRYLYRRLEEHNSLLEEKVRERTHKLEEAQHEIVHRLGMAGDYRDDETGDHCRRVGDLSCEIALECGLPTHAASVLRLAAQLHDIGKLGIPDSILKKGETLTDEEFEEMKKHTSLGARILEGSKTEILQTAYVIALTHHERWDGAGYPHGLKGEEIPLPGRIVSVADVFDALSSERHYKSSWSPKEAIAEICASAGSQFDPLVVEAFVRVMSRRDLKAA